MSIKSQKELYEECSEIFEKSYSVRSLSEDSSSGFDEEELLARELLTRLSPAVLSKLRKKFIPTTIKQDEDIQSKVEIVMAAAAAAEGVEFPAQTQERAHTAAGLASDADTFLSTVNNIFGGPKYTVHAQKLFNLLDPFRTGRIWWADLLDELVKIGARKTRSRVDVWTAITPKHMEMKRMQHSKRETIVALVSMENDGGFCYAAVSRGGRVGLYSGALGARPLFSYRALGEGRQRVRNTWITDAVYMTVKMFLARMRSVPVICHSSSLDGNGIFTRTRDDIVSELIGLCTISHHLNFRIIDAKCLVLSASNRSVIFIDAGAGGLTHSIIYRIISLPNIPTSMAYESSEGRAATSELAWGDDRGDLTSLTFLQPRLMLLHKTHADKTNIYYWTDLTSGSFEAYVRVRRWRRLVARSVRRVVLCRRLSSVVVCSHHAAAALLIKHRPGLLDDYVFKVVRGVSCFHVCGTSRMLATGGPDGILRLWEPARLTPLAQLASSARAPIKDVAIVSSREIVLSFNKNCTLDIWDIFEEVLLQTLKLNFPFLGVLGKRVEYGAYCIYPGPPRKKCVEQPRIPKDGVSSEEEGQSAEEIETPREREYWERSSGLKDDPEYILWDKPDFIITCCDWLWRVTCLTEILM